MKKIISVLLILALAAAGLNAFVSQGASVVDIVIDNCDTKDRCWRGSGSDAAPVVDTQRKVQGTGSIKYVSVGWTVFSIRHSNALSIQGASYLEFDLYVENARFFKDATGSVCQIVLSSAEVSASLGNAAIANSLVIPASALTALELTANSWNHIKLPLDFGAGSLDPAQFKNIYFKSNTSAGATVWIDNIRATDGIEAALASLSISEGNLSPAFDPDITSYAAAVRDDVTSIELTAAKAAATDTVTGTGTYDLAPGANVLTVNVQTQAGAARAYTVTVTRAAPLVGNIPINNCDTTAGCWRGNPSDAIALDTDVKTEGSASLKYTAPGQLIFRMELAAPVNILAASFLEFDLYTDNVNFFKNGTDCGINLTSNGTQDSGLKISAATLKGLTLTAGWNHIKVPLDFASGPNLDPTQLRMIRFYSIVSEGAVIRLDNIRATDGIAPQLDSLTVGKGCLTPAFDPAVTSYAVTVRGDIASIEIAAATNTAGDTVAGAGTYVLNEGANPVPITVGSPDGDVKTYTVTVTRAAPFSGKATVNDCDAAIGFTPATGTDVIEPDTAEKTQGAASIKYTDPKKLMLCLSLSEKNILAAPYLEFDLYTENVNIFKNAADCGINITSNSTWDVGGRVNRATLQGLTLVPGWNRIKVPLDFAAWGAYVNLEKVTRMRFYAVYGADTATLVRLDNIQVTDGIDPELASLSVDQGTLAPAFDPNVTAYAVTVGSGVASVTISAAAAAAGDTVAGTGAHSLNFGPNTLAVSVESPDGDVKTYTVVVTRTAPPSGNVPVHDCDTAAGFTPATGNDQISADASEKTQGAASVKYTDPKKMVLCLTVDPLDLHLAKYLEFDLYTENVDIFKNAVDCGINITSNGTWDNGGKISAAILKGLTLTSGWNHIKVPLDFTAWGALLDASSVTKLRFYAVYAADTQTLVRLDDIRATDGVDPNAGPQLASLSVDKGTLTPAFDPAVTAYTVWVGNGVASVQVSAAGAAGAAVAGAGAHSLNVGANTITVTVTAQGGGAPAAYILTVTRAAPPSGNIPVKDCDSLIGFTPATGNDQIFLDTGVKTQGRASIRYTDPKDMILCLTVDPLDLRLAKYLEFDFWTDDVNIFKYATDCGINITSNGTWDNGGKISAAVLKGLTLTSGWNHIKVSLDFETWGALVDASNVSKMRFYAVHSAPGAKLVRFDDIRTTAPEGGKTPSGENDGGDVQTGDFGHSRETLAVLFAAFALAAAGILWKKRRAAN